MDGVSDFFFYCSLVRLSNSLELPKFPTYRDHDNPDEIMKIFLTRPTFEDLEN